MGGSSPHALFRWCGPYAAALGGQRAILPKSGMRMAVCPLVVHKTKESFHTENKES